MRRCERHDLACRPDGTCLLCERDTGATASRAPVIVALAVLAGVAIAGVLYTQRPRLQPIAAIPTETTADTNALKSAALSVPIVVYTTTWCPQCKRAKAWLNDNSYSFVEHDIEASESARAECKKLNPRLSIPTIDIEGEVVIGYGPAHMQAAIDAAARRRLAK